MPITTPWKPFQRNIDPSAANTASCGPHHHGGPSQQNHSSQSFQSQSQNTWHGNNTSWQHIPPTTTNNHHDSSSAGSPAAAMIEGIAAYFASSPNVLRILGEALVSWFDEHEQELMRSEVNSTILTTTNNTQNVTNSPQPQRASTKFQAPCCSSVPYVITIGKNVVIRFDPILLGCASPHALELFFDDPWGMFQRCARAALTTFFTKSFLSHIVDSSQQGGVAHPPMLFHVDDIIPPHLTMWLMLRLRDDDGDHQQHHHCRGGNKQQQQQPLTLLLEDGVAFAPLTMASVFLPNFTQSKLSEEGEEGDDVTTHPNTVMNRAPLQPTNLSRFGKKKSAGAVGVTLAFRSIVVGCPQTPPVAHNNNSSHQPHASSSSTAARYVELAQLRSLHHHLRNVNGSQRKRNRRDWFLDASVTVNIGLLSPDDQQVFELGRMVAWMGRCIPIIAPGGGCDDRGAQQKYIIDVYCILPSDVHQMDGITAFIQGTTSPHDHFMDRPHFSTNVSGVEISCRVPHRSTESSSLWEAVRCWTSVFEAFSLHCPSCPPGWIMESQGINVPVLIVCVMISAALPNCSLHLACVTSGASSQMNYLCSLMRRLELATCGNVRSVGYTNADRRLMPATVSTSSSATTCRAGTLTVCARSGEVAFVGDLDRYSPSVLRLLRMNMLRTSLSVAPASKEGEERGVSSNCTTPSSIAFVGGRASSSSRETCVEEYLADCDLLTGFSRPPPAAMVCQQLSAFYQQQHAVESLTADEASSSSSHDSSVDSSWQVLSMLLHPDVTSLFTLPELSPGATLLLDRYFVTHCTSSCNRNSAMSTLVKIASAHATFRTAWNLLATQHEQRTLAGKLLQLQQDLRSALEAAEVLSVDAIFAICSVRECSQRIHGQSEHHTVNDGSNGVVFTAPSPADVVLPQSTSRLMQEVIDAAHQVHNDLRTSSSPVAEASLHNWWLQSYVDGIVSC